MLTTFPLIRLVGTSQHLYLIISANLRNFIYFKVLKERIKLDLGEIGVFLTKTNLKKNLNNLSHLDTNTSVSNFYFKIETLLDEMVPLKKLIKKEIGLQQRPWITPDIIAAINERNKLY